MLHSQMSLINVLFGMLLGSLVVAGVTQWYVVAKKFFLLQAKHFDSLEMGRVSFHYLQRDLQSAGYRGCRTNDETFPVNHIYSPLNRKFQFFNFNQAVFGFIASPGACYGKMPDISCKRIKKNTPVLIIYNVPQKINRLVNDLKFAEDAISLPHNHGIHENSLVLINDCHHGDLFIANRVETTKIYHNKIINVNESDALSRGYVNKNAVVVELQTIAYYLGVPERYEKEHHKNLDIAQVNAALFRDDLLQQAQEIVSDVSDLMFEFGIKTSRDDKDKMSYRTLTQMREHDWPCVQLVRVTIVDTNKQRWIYEISLRNRCSACSGVDLLARHFMVGHRVMCADIFGI